MMLGLPAGEESRPGREEAGSVLSTPQAVMASKSAATTCPRNHDELSDTVVSPPAVG